MTRFSKKPKDEDYCFLTTRLRSLENSMLTRERMESMLESGNLEDAVKVLQECGYGEVSAVSAEALEESLAAEREKIFREVAFFAPDPSIVDVFRIRYDYHNAKVLLKAEAQGLDGAKLLIDAGRIPAKELSRAVLSSVFIGIPGMLQEAILEGREVLGTTKDPQLGDAVLDRAYFAEMFQMAARTGSKFLNGYVRSSIDAANLRSVVRAARIGKGADFLRTVLFERGNIDIGRILELAISGASLEDFYSTSLLAQAAAVGAAVIQGGAITQFERLCDDAVNRYLSGARYAPFGEQPVIFHLAARELEYTAVRIIITGLMAGLPPDTILERLREVYV